MADSVHMRNNTLYCAYGTKANGLVYVGEDNDHGALGDLDREMLLMAVAEWRDPYAQYFINHCEVEIFVPNERHALARLAVVRRDRRGEAA